MLPFEPFLGPPSSEKPATTDSPPTDAEGTSKFEMEFYAAVLERNPNFVDVLRCQGELLAQQGRYGDAVRVDRRLAQLRPTDSIVHYNLACSLARDNQPAEALTALQTAFERGYSDFAYLTIDRDLDTLRDLPEFQALLGKFQLS